MRVNAERKRHYVHGDLHETRSQTYYCARCDMFAPPKHFEEPAQDAEKLGQLRVIDESGEDYLYPKKSFIAVALPQPTRRAVLQAA